MGFYIVPIVAFCSVVFSFTMMVTPKQNPPEKLGDFAYSKSKLAIWLNKKRNKSKYLGPLRIDKFHFVGFVSSFFILILSLFLMIIDLFSGQAIYEFITDLTTIIIATIIFLWHGGP